MKTVYIIIKITDDWGRSRLINDHFYITEEYAKAALQIQLDDDITSDRGTFNYVIKPMTLDSKD